jgi:leucyl/phenylalanyl-tRNA---protein transferase
VTTQRPSRIDPERPTPQMLLWAYAQGIFPMADPDTGRIDWYCPDPRGILPLDAFHVPKNLAREVRKAKFDIRFDTAFDQVMRSCAVDRSPLNQSWINDRLIRAYTDLHAMGHAHSVEAWLKGKLVGGLYGVSLGGAFFGESMFSRPARGGTNASKVCLVHLVNHLKHRGYVLLDTQFTNPHLEQFGCIEIPLDEYLQRLSRAIRLPVDWTAPNAQDI